MLILRKEEVIVKYSNSINWKVLGDVPSVYKACENLFESDWSQFAWGLNKGVLVEFMPVFNCELAGRENALSRPRTRKKPGHKSTFFLTLSTLKRMVYKQSFSAQEIFII